MKIKKVKFRRDTMGVKKLGELELIEEKYLRTVITEGESIAIRNKNRVFRDTLKHFTRIDERDDENIPDMRELYYRIKVDENKELSLEAFRLIARDERGKQIILNGLLEMLLLVSDGKIYEVELNPLNFIAEDKPDIGTVYIKAFYRRDRGLREITNDWLESAKKLLGYFLVSDTGVNVENYDELTSVDIYPMLKGNIAKQYMRILKSKSIDDIARDWFTEEKYRQIKGFPPIVTDFREPKDVTDVGEVLLQRESKEEEPEQEDVMEQYDDIEEETEEVEKKSFIQGLLGGKLVKRLLLLVGVVVVLFIGVKLFSGDSSIEKVDSNFYKGLVSSSVQKYKEAGEYFDVLTEEQLEVLGEVEREAVFVTYLKAGEYDKALEINPGGAESLITYLEKADELDELDKIVSTLPPIEFEKAVKAKDYEMVLELQELVELTKRRNKKIVEAMILTGDIDGAVEYIQLNNLEEMKEQVEKNYKKYEESEKEDISKEERKRVKEMIKELP